MFVFMGKIWQIQTCGRDALLALVDHLPGMGKIKSVCVISQVFCRLMDSFVACTVLAADGVVPPGHPSE